MKKVFEDCKHMGWLFRQMIVHGIKGNWEGSYDAWCWVKIHWKYESKKINK